jgi:hypothetical protein
MLAGHLETDASLLWCRTHATGTDTRVAVVDGSVVRTIDGRTLLTLPAAVRFKETVA